MKLLNWMCLFMLFCFSIAVLAQAGHPSPSPTVAVVAHSQAASQVSASAVAMPAMVGVMVSCVLLLNILLTGIQKIFTQLGKKEPSKMTSFSQAVAKIAQWLGSNPTL